MGNDGSPEARRLALRLIETLGDFRASLGDSIPYGQKITVSRRSGERLGQLVVYAGKKGPRLVTTELTSATEQELGLVGRAWAVSRGLPEPSGALELPGSSDGGVELWVDGACLQHGDGLQFGWAFAVCANNALLYTEHGQSIPEDAVQHRNVGAELEATLRGLAWCVEQRFDRVIVHHDYLGISAWVTGAWRAKTRLTQQYADRVRALPLAIRWKHVRGHTGVAMNELVDRLATTSARSCRLYRPDRTESRRSKS